MPAGRRAGPSPASRSRVLVAGPLLALPLSFVGQGGRVRPDRREPAAGGAAGERRAGARRRRRHAAARRRRWRCSSRSSTSRAAAGSSGRSCCRWRCRPTCSCSCCSASTTRPARCSAALGLSLPDIRTTLGTIVVLTVVLYPYVYVLGRSAFLGQSRQTLEAARTLGHSYGGAVRRVALPLARPALAGGRRARGHGGAGRLRRGQPARLPLADRRDLPRLVRRVRPGGGAAARDRAGLARADARRARAAAARARPLPARRCARGDAVVPRRLHGPAALAGGGRAGAAARCSWSSPPVVQLVAWAVDSLGEGASLEALVRAARQQPAAGRGRGGRRRGDRDGGRLRAARAAASRRTGRRRG